KKSGLQDYLVVYDDVAMSSGHTAKAFWHYWYGGGANTVNPSGTNIENIGPNSKLNAAHFSVGGPNSLAVLAEGGDYTGHSGRQNSYRVTSCASTDGSTCASSPNSFEEGVVFEPVNGTSGTMPTINQPNCFGTGGNCTVLEIADDSAPKVAVF